ncbi:MaoC family dehydratase [Roseomonas sp. AR75]|jgi:acyl dehydratase|uniref:MaoC family dehydratase n=1 Tax=Roseomonas sp. AR75 TaxID=2562311 RepID=UPI0010C00519|nr:MaoC family dehydratase [Roseomonas sp. AR75]
MTGHYWEDFEPGRRFPTYGRTITEGDLSFFCAFVGYHVPLFIDEHAARKTRFGGRIVPSGMIMAISTAMTESLYRDTMLGQLSIENGRFLAPVRPGDTIRTEVEVVSRRESKDATRGIVVFRDHVTNQDGVEVFSVDKATLVARRPGHGAPGA